jgi:hypothetical protein
VRDVKVGVEAIYSQNRSNPSVHVRKAPRAFVGQDGILRRTGSPPLAAFVQTPRRRVDDPPQAASLPHITPARGSGCLPERFIMAPAACARPA